MTRYKFSYIDLTDSLDQRELRLNGGFELADVERARQELKKTQKEQAGMKLNSKPITLKDARRKIYRKLLREC